MPVAFDTETHLIKPGLQLPPLVCASFCDGGEPVMYVRSETRDVIEALLDSDEIIIGHNVAYDLLVVWMQWPELLSKIFAAYEADRVTDTMLREKLIHIGSGIAFKYKAKGSYSLESVALRRTGLQLEKGTWQLRYAELDGLPLSEYPEDAQLYALADAFATYLVWEKQQKLVKWLEDQYRQARAALWIQFQRATGMRTDPQRVKVFSDGLRERHAKAHEQLVGMGLVREDGSRDTKAAKQAAVLYSMWSPDKSRGLDRTAKGAVQLSKDACSKIAMPSYSDYSSITKQISTDIPLLEKGVVDPIHPYFEVLLVTGRTSSSPNVQNLPRYGGMRECFVPRPGYVLAAADYSMFELRTVSQVCIHLGWDSKLGAALNEGLDPHLQMAALMLHISYEEAMRRKAAGDREVDDARQSGKVCFHPDTEVLTHTGWQKISELSPEDEVCSAKLSDDGGVELEWEVPLALTSRDYRGELVHLKNEGIDLRVTPDHRMCGWRSPGKVATVLPDELGTLWAWPNAGHAGGHSLDEWSVRVFARDAFTNKKKLPWACITLDQELREIVLEEARFWSSSWSREDVDVLQALATLSSKKSRSFRNGDTYELHVEDSHLSDSKDGLSTERIPYDGKVYCLTTRNDTVVVRDGGVPVITRQCNFGFPGGLGYLRFVDFARNNYGVTVTPNEAIKLKEFWTQAWPEFKRDYFPWVGKLCDGENPTIQHVYSNRYRGDIGFTEACNCLDDKTEALTKRGWVPGFDLKPGDFLMTKNAETGEMSWQPITRLYFYPDYEGPLTEFRTKNFSAITTPNHRWLVQAKNGKNVCKTTEQIGANGDFRIHRTGDYCAPEAPVFTDDFVELVGWVLTDGSLPKGRNRLVLYQSRRANAPKVLRIDQLFDRLKLSPKRTVDARSQVVRWQLTGGTSVVHLLKEMFPEKVLTQSFLKQLTKSQLHLLFETMMLGDGTRSRTQASFCTGIKEAADQFQVLCTMIGKASKVSWRDMSKYSPRSSKLTNIPRSKGVWHVAILDRETVQVVNLKRQYGLSKTQTTQRRDFVAKEPVWCVAVRNGFFVVRREGATYITGNSFFQGLAADAAKNAGFLIAKACYLDKLSPLHGCFMWNFVHDEFIVEAPEDRAAEAAEELARLMVVGAAPFLPDVPPIAEPLLMRRWSKKAKTIRDKNGRLVPWEP